LWTHGALIRVGSAVMRAADNKAVVSESRWPDIGWSATPRARFQFKIRHEFVSCESARVRRSAPVFCTGLTATASTGEQSSFSAKSLMASEYRLMRAPSGFLHIDRSRSEPPVVLPDEAAALCLRRHLPVRLPLRRALCALRCRRGFDRRYGELGTLFG
jgi:hypothetical protein